MLATADRSLPMWNRKRDALASTETGLTAKAAGRAARLVTFSSRQFERRRHANPCATR